MALDTYADLKSSVADWLHRSDLTTAIPDFIRLAEVEINRRLKVRAKEIEAPLVAEVGSRFVALPSDFGSPIGLWSDYIEPRYEFVAVTAQQLTVNDDLLTLPRYWAIDGGNIAFECRADQAYPLELRYLQTLFLSDASPTNDLFARAPDLYLYGALSQAAPYMMDDARFPMWKAEFKALLRSVAAEGSRDKGIVELKTEIPGSMINSAWRRIWGY